MLKRQHGHFSRYYYLAVPLHSTIDMESQPQAARRIYNARASTYEDSWHPDYSKRMMGLVPIRPGDKVLVLCCGTGLESFIAASAVGVGGVVVGVDVSPGMLAEAWKRQEREPELGSRVKWVQHDVTDLDSSVELQRLVDKGTIDVLVCSNAFVLFDRPSQVVASWKPWLKDSGVMSIDIAHEKNMIQGMLIEKVAEVMGLSWPTKRRWVESQDSFRRVLENEGMVITKLVLLYKVLEKPVLEYNVAEADAQFEYAFNSPFASHVRWTDEEIRDAKKLFKKEWESIAKTRRVESTDALYLYVVKKM